MNLQPPAVPESLARLVRHEAWPPPPVTLIGRVLEDGDSNEIRWLFERLGAEAVRSWVRERGDRQLSTRSRAYWAVVLGLPEPASDPTREDLWPL